MPNWCKNQFTIQGPQPDLEAFIVCAQGYEPMGDVRGQESKFCLDRFIPIPAEIRMAGSMSHPRTKEDEAKIERLTELYGAGNWYDWQIKNWGCKWGTNEVQITNEPGKAVFEYLTPDAPFNSHFLTVMSGIFPTLRMDLIWSESGMGVKGIMAALGGSILANETAWMEEHERGDF